ncbi:MAG: PIN domain-containing protein [Actinobacteria bacterium]|nr:PIN domain-containing protein [Actinomycetota bacterium]
MTTFVDTSAWYAAADRADRSHDRATLRLREFEGQLVTSDHVLIETWHLASSRLGTDVAENLVNSIRNGIARVECATLADLEQAASIRDAYPDQQFSIVARTSWSVMLRIGVHQAIAFDRDYSIYRFGRDRRQAFVVHT